VQVWTVQFDFINTSLNGYIWFLLCLVKLTHALYFSFTHLSSVMFKHELCSIHFQQYQFELQYLVPVKPVVVNIPFHFLSALTSCWNQHIQAIILRCCCLPLIYLVDVKPVVLVTLFHVLTQDNNGSGQHSTPRLVPSVWRPYLDRALIIHANAHDQD
jgi:hypothetical protein